jgi:catechol 2,3-dioxygenase-like lactoylglutathione lyase family enzyme
MRLQLRSTFTALLATAALTLLPAGAQEPAEIKRPAIVGLSHIGLYVHDLDQSREFYTNFLGFAQAPYVKKNKDGTIHLIWIKINDTQTLELFQEPTNRVGDPDRLYHLALQTDDAEGMRQYLGSKGVKVPATTPLGMTKNKNYFIHDPDDHIVEIVEYMPDGATMKDEGHSMPETRISAHMPHAGLTVRDLEASMKFYRDILGFKEIWRGSSNGKTLSWVHMRVPDGTDFIELMLEHPTPARIGSLHHFCLEVPDIVKVSETLKARTLPAGCKPPTEMKAGINHKRQINYFDPDGTRVELMEHNTVDGKPAPSSDAPPPLAKAE